MIDAFLTALPVLLLTFAGCAFLMGCVWLGTSEVLWRKVLGWGGVVAVFLGVTVLGGYDIEGKEKRRQALEDCGCLEAEE